MHDKIPLSEIMVEDVVTVPIDAGATEAATLMRDEGVSSVVVVENGSPAGIVTEGNFVNYVIDHEYIGDVALTDLMSDPLTTIESDATIYEAVELLRSSDVEHLPVVDEDGDLEGIVTTIELSYFVPQLVHPAVRLKSYPPRRTVGTDTQYKREDWEFEYRSEDAATVSVGSVAQFSKRITEEDVEAFAEVTGDTNRLHLDPEYAGETRFQERIVHGVLSNGLISAALARLPGLSIYLSQRSTFLAPVEVGDELVASCEVIDDLGESKYRIATTVRDDDDELVLEGEAVVLIDEPPSVSVLEES